MSNMTKGSVIFTSLTVVALFANSCISKNSDPHAGMNHNANGTAVSNQATIDHPDHSVPMDHSAMKSSPNAAAADYDLQFIDTMIADHQGAVDMARLISTRAEHAELKMMGTNIIASQQKEIDEMRAWRERWFAGKPAAVNMEMPGMSDSMKGMDLKMLEPLRGKAFDLEFIRQMIPHHDGAVVMAREALQRSQRDEVKKLANAIIKDQQAEIEQMRIWHTRK